MNYQSDLPEGKREINNHLEHSFITGEFVFACEFA